MSGKVGLLYGPQVMPASGKMQVHMYSIDSELAPGYSLITDLTTRKRIQAMAFNPYCKTLVNRLGTKCILQAVLPDGTFLYKQTDKTGRLILVDKDGAAPGSGQLLIYDGSKPKPSAERNYAKGSQSDFVTGKVIAYVNFIKKPYMAIRATLVEKTKKGNCWIVRLPDGEFAKALPFQILTAEDAKMFLEDALKGLNESFDEGTPKPSLGILRKKG